MAKVFGIQGYVTGKVGNTVFAVRHGEQIGRQYNPVVANPKSTAQTTARAKFKLLSQLGEVLRSYIAIPRKGNVSARNQFMKVNYPAATFASEQATIDITSVQLTDSLVQLGGLIGTTSTENTTVRLTGRFSAENLSRVVYVMFAREGNSLRYLGEAVATTPGETQHWPVTTLPLAEGNAVVYAYGIKDLSALARQTFGNMQIVSAETIAKLVVTNVFGVSDVAFTTTSAWMINASQSSKVDEGNAEVRAAKKK